MTNHKFTDDQIIRCLNACDGYNEAVKKFAERLKEYGHPIHSLVDKLVKEMTEENTHEMQSTDQP